MLRLIRAMSAIRKPPMRNSMSGMLSCQLKNGCSLLHTAPCDDSVRCRPGSLQPARRQPSRSRPSFKPPGSSSGRSSSTATWWCSRRARRRTACSISRTAASSCRCCRRPARKRSWRCSGPATSSARAAWPASRCAWARPRRWSPTAVLRIAKREMVRLLHEQPEFSDRFISHMLTRNIRIEEDLVDQLFNSSEKRLARTLLLLARYGKEDTPSGRCRRSRRRRSPRWSARRARASTSS